jgi:hypothetical protein
VGEWKGYLERVEEEKRRSKVIGGVYDMGRVR